MFDVFDTIAAFSSASLTDGAFGRSVLRVCGPATVVILREVFGNNCAMNYRGIYRGCFEVEDGLAIDVTIYSFPGPASYTGEDVAEVHVYASPVVLEIMLTRVLEHCRMAGGGEFTLRAYLNGKLDLSQAEAVGQIVAASNKFQLEAAEKLLAGRLCETVGTIREEMLDVLSLIEAGMDFSEEDIEFISADDAAERIGKVCRKLDTLLNQTIYYEEMIDLPSVALAGAANAGKSSLANVLLGSERSIVSDERGTTRDVLEGVLELGGANALLFDCAGIGDAADCAGVLDELGRAAAEEAIGRAGLVLFCTDVTADDYAVLLAKRYRTPLILVGTKCDLLDADELDAKQADFEEVFSMRAIMTSSHTGVGIDELAGAIEKAVAGQTAGSAEAGERIAINERHRSVVKKALEDAQTARKEMSAGNGEVAAMLLRSGYEVLSQVEREDVNEAVLDRIFSNFCVGK